MHHATHHQCTCTTACCPILGSCRSRVIVEPRVVVPQHQKSRGQKSFGCRRTRPRYVFDWAAVTSSPRKRCVATTRGGDLWCGAGSQVGLRCPTSSCIADRPLHCHTSVPLLDVAAPPYLPNRGPPLPPLSLLCARRVPPVCPASALPLSMLTSLNCTLPLPL